ncbi:MAG: hypothetical protein JXB47_20215 [Anaerolineae bacterium]|nr:hypothetical protein [Anaerolineae bacterium]
MNVTVTNHSLEPALASGNWYPIRQPDGNRHWVTLLKAAHREVPVPMTWDREYGTAPLWQFLVTTSDGLIFQAYAGCRYHETIFANGWEPSAQGGYYWEVTLDDGWFRCGWDDDPLLKPAHDLRPGESATVPLEIWLVHPRDANPPRRTITRLDFIPSAPDGTSFGIQHSVTVP